MPDYIATGSANNVRALRQTTRSCSLCHSVWKMPKPTEMRDNTSPTLSSLARISWTGLGEINCMASDTTALTSCHAALCCNRKTVVCPTRKQSNFPLPKPFHREVWCRCHNVHDRVDELLVKMRQQKIINTQPLFANGPSRLQQEAQVCTLVHLQQNPGI